MRISVGSMSIEETTKMITTIKPMVAHRATSSVLGPVEGSLFEYLMAGNGVFVRGEREGLSALFPIAKASIRGLADLKWAVHLTNGRVPGELLSEAVEHAREAAKRHLESLYHFTWDGKWNLEIPPQDQSGGAVRPTDCGAGSSYQQAVVELHSHHRMRADFSNIDDADETGFRIYGVMGRLGVQGREEIRWRVGVFGHLQDIPCKWVAENPEHLIDCTRRDQRHFRLSVEEEYANETW
jgi:PRTRC genetic system protein A